MEAPATRESKTARDWFVERWQKLKVDLGWVLGLFLVGMGMKLFYILNSHGQLPFWDQWNGEAADTFIPYFEHQLSLANLFKAHNEHRVFFTRIFALAVLLINGQWDAQLQMVLNACLHCGTVTGFGWLMARLMGAKYWPFIWLPLALVLVLPFGWENALWAFQSLFYFQLAFSLLAVWLLGVSKPLSPRWRLGVLAAAASVFTTGSGFLSVLAVAAIASLDLLKNGQNWRQHWPTLAVCAVIAVAGILLLPDEPEHYEIRAHSVGEYFTALGNYLSWPTGLWPWLALLNVFPLFLLGWVYIRAEEKPHPAARMILGVGFWVLLQGLAAAYARGVGGKPPVWRYMDTACFLMIANCLSIAMLLGHYRSRLRFKPVLWTAFAAWAIPCAFSLWLLTDRAWTVAIPLWAERQEARLESARAFMATDDEKVFLKQDPFYIPHPYVPFLVFLMRAPHIREALPACVREPLKVEPGTNSTTAFITNGCNLLKPDPPTEKCWGSYSATGVAAQGIFESAPVKPGRFSRLEIPVAGDLGKPGLTLEFLETRSGRITSIRPRTIAGGQWVNAYVRTPESEFKIIARDESPVGWFAFKAPREIAWLSYAATRLVSAWKGTFVTGLACLTLGIASLFVPRGRKLGAP